MYIISVPVSALEAPKAVKPNWELYYEVDPMTDQTYSVYATKSTKYKVELSLLRKDELEILLYRTDGQFVCLDTCPAALRFDDHPLMDIEVKQVQSKAHNAIVLPNSILPELFASKEVKIQVTLYPEGQQVLDFNTEGFNKKYVQ